eukprot:TRINITY_DN37971_c0_g1_i1.p1 TRINITY_DN37971_c0_g1~~TRINITY_DN37971_c0_g1_i1.p1  ORF type:complete len:315 (+),score=37.46 TRINITY_DN37971_c0_g1_i1:3-947(+)
MAHSLPDLIEDLKQRYLQHDAILVLAGAGMGVESGIGTFRGKSAGVWPEMETYGTLPKAPDGSTGLSQMNNKRWFEEDPEMAWKFWRWCHEGYAKTSPHNGYTVIKRILDEKPGFVATTNIDSHFEKAGINPGKLRELHGVVSRVVCSGMGRDTTAASQIGGEDDLRPIDFAEDFAENEVTDTEPCGFTTTFASLPSEGVPRCGCTAVLRPDVTLFGDVVWPSNPPPGPLALQFSSYTSYLTSVEHLSLLILEIGVGTAMPALRKLSESLLSDRSSRTSVVRINTEEAEGSSSILSIPFGAGIVLGKLQQALDT